MVSYIAEVTVNRFPYICYCSFVNIQILLALFHTFLFID